MNKLKQKMGMFAQRVVDWGMGNGSGGDVHPPYCLIFYHQHRSHNHNHKSYIKLHTRSFVK